MVSNTVAKTAQKRSCMVVIPGEVIDDVGDGCHCMFLWQLIDLFNHVGHVAVVDGFNGFSREYGYVDLSHDVFL